MKKPRSQFLTPRKQKRLEQERAALIAELIRRGWLDRRAEIPAGALLVNPSKLMSFGMNDYHTPWYEDIPFTCKDCGTQQVWPAESQQWYYETLGRPLGAGPHRCRECRQKERERVRLARIASGHALPGTDDDDESGKP